MLSGRGISSGWITLIDGAAGDVDEIRKFNYPVFARAIVPNAGEPKGYGEIGVELAK
jgi:3-hexulose-6-phosphate synthase/6-phospho-3-hexuloisomerase